MWLVSAKISIKIIKNLGKKKSHYIFALGLDATATTLSSSLYTVDDGQCTVIFDRVRGILNETVGEGTHFLIPWLQKPSIFDIHTKPHTFLSFS